MESCQRDIRDELVTETGLLFPVAIVVDSSGEMGGYDPEGVEEAVNAFFSRVAGQPDADALVEVCVYEAYDEVVFLGGPGKASDFMLDELRYGGEWSLADAVAEAMQSLVDYATLLDCNGRIHATPLIVAISDTVVPDELGTFEQLDYVVANARDRRLTVPDCVFVSTRASNCFADHLPRVYFNQATRDTIVECMIQIANRVAAMVRPVQWVDTWGILSERSAK